jgi:hypothetical protein
MVRAAGVSQAARTRRYRARQRAGVVMLTVSVDHHSFADVLIAGEWLTPDEALERENLERAASQIICEWMRSKAEKV